MMLGSTLDAAVCYACLSVLLALLARACLSLRSVRQRTTPFGLVLAGFAAVGFAVRALAPPAFIHAGFAGYSLLDSILTWPSVTIYKPGYGHASFISLGLACRLLQSMCSGWRATLLANAAFGTGILVAASLLARRIGGPVAGLATMAVGLLHPLFVRTSASEDAHVVACFYGMVALVAAERVRREGFTLAPLLVLLAAGLLAFYGRQSMFFWPLLLVLVACWGRFRDLARRRATWAVVIALAACAVPKMLVLIFGSEESYALLLRWTVPLLTSSLMTRHPLLLLGESGALLIALAGALVAIVKTRDPTLTILAAGAAIAFVSSFAMSAQPGWALEYGFRLPLFTLLLPLAGVGVARLVDVLRGDHRVGSASARFISVAVILVTCVYPAPALSRVLRQPSPMAQEYRFIAEGMKGLPQVVPADITAFLGPTSELKVPRSAFGKGAHIVESSGALPHTRYAYQSLGCFCYPIKELVGPSGPDFNARISAMDNADFRRFVEALWSDPVAAFHQLGGGPPSQQMRPECVAAFRGAIRFIPWGDIEIGQQEPLDRYVTLQRVPVGLWELPR